MNEDFQWLCKEGKASDGRWYWRISTEWAAGWRSRNLKIPFRNPVTMAERYHLFPSRTQQLSSHASKVLGWKRPGRIDCCRSETKPPYYTCGGFYYGSDVWDFRFLLILFNFLYISRNAVSLQRLIIFKIFPVLLIVHFCETRYNKIIMY